MVPDGLGGGLNRKRKKIKLLVPKHKNAGILLLVRMTAIHIIIDYSHPKALSLT